MLEKRCHIIGVTLVELDPRYIYYSNFYVLLFTCVSRRSKKLLNAFSPILDPIKLKFHCEQTR